MTQKQYIRANSTLYPMLMILYVFLFLFGIGIIFTKGVNVSDVVQSVVSLIAMIVTTYAFMTKKDTKSGATTLMATAAIVYLIIMCVNHDNNVYIYALPILCFCIIYLNIIYVISGSAVTLLGIIIHAVKLAVEKNLEVQTLVITIMISALVMAGAYGVCRLLTKFNAENIEAQSKQYDTMFTVADDLMHHFDEAVNMLENTKQSVETSRRTIEEIAGSSESTAEAIQKQAVMCNEIMESTDNAEQKTKNMIESAERTRDTVAEGGEVIEGLKEQARNVQNISRTAAKSSKELSNRVEEVRGIIGAILSISSQTNLLALNASIEAARAGESGRGFAVVAEEIRQLSVQTQEATSKITDIINDLNMEVEKTVSNMENSAKSIEKQTELIDDTQNRFDMIDREVKSLTDIIGGIDEVMQAITDSTQVITDNISHLSATSEEVAASTEEGVRISEEAFKNTDELAGIIDVTYRIAKDLKNFRVEE